MSLDYPDYEKIQTKNRLCAFVWMVGDRSYYLGLLGVLLIIIEAPISLIFTWLKGSRVGLPLFNWQGLIALISCFLLFCFGSILKDYACRRAGIKE